MKERIYKFLLKYFSPLLLFVLIIPIAVLLELSSNSITYLGITAVFIVLNYYLVIAFLSISRDKYDKNTLYIWLDQLDGRDKLLLDLFVNVKSSKNILENLEIVFNQINILTHYKC
jgi:hypothetical protein